MLVTASQFDQARHFVYRHGDLLTRRRFAYHFEHGSQEAVLDALACYQNDDGGFGNGLELDLLCPASSGICAEVAFDYLVELGVCEGDIVDRGIHWVVSNQTANGDLPHPPREMVTKYPHGTWWETDEGRILSLAGLLGTMGQCPPEVSRRAAAVFEETHLSFPDTLKVYMYPLSLYLHYGDLEGRHRQHLPALESAFVNMLTTEAWHHPLFFRYGRWTYDGISAKRWEAEAKRAIATLQADGGVCIERYAALPWWRPVWTVDLFVALEHAGFLGKQ